MVNCNYIFYLHKCPWGKFPIQSPVAAVLNKTELKAGSIKRQYFNSDVKRSKAAGPTSHRADRKEKRVKRICLDCLETKIFFPDSFQFFI